MFNKHRVGIDIGSISTKIVYGSINKEDIRVKGYKILDTPQNAFLPNQCLNVKVLKDIITKGVEELKCKREDIYISLWSPKAVVRERKLPKVKPREMLHLVKYEAEEFLPQGIKDFTIDYKVIGEYTEDPSMFRVLIVAVPKEIIESYMELIEVCGLKLKAIDIFSNSIYKFGKIYCLKEEFNTLIVDIGGKHTKAFIFTNKEYFAEIYSDIGGLDVTNSLSQVLNMDRAKAEEAKLSEGNLGYTPKANFDNESFTLTTTIKKSYDDIISEVSRVVDFFRTRGYGAQVHSIFVLGGGSNIPGIEEYFTANLGVDVKTVPIIDSNIPKNDFSRIIPAIGAMLREE